LQEFKALATARGGVFVLLYLPTSPLRPDVNRIAFKDLAKDAISQLREAAVSERIIDSFRTTVRHSIGPDLGKPG